MQYNIKSVAMSNESAPLEQEINERMTTAPLEKFSRTHKKSEVVFGENNLGKEMYIIHSGVVKIYKERAPGKRPILLTTSKAGGFFGEMALVDLSPRSATAIAAEDNTQPLALDESKFLYLLRQQPEFALTLMQRLCQRLREANQIIAELKQARLKGR